MNRILTVLPFVVALPILIGSALLQGSKTERWGQFPEMKEFASRLTRLPMSIGPWQGKIGTPMEEDTRRYAGAEGDVQIIYTNSNTRAQVERVPGLWPTDGHVESSARPLLSGSRL